MDRQRRRGRCAGRRDLDDLALILGSTEFGGDGRPDTDFVCHDHIDACREQSSHGFGVIYHVDHHRKTERVRLADHGLRFILQVHRGKIDGMVSKQACPPETNVQLRVRPYELPAGDRWGDPLRLDHRKRVEGGDQHACRIVDLLQRGDRLINDRPLSIESSFRLPVLDLHVDRESRRYRGEPLLKGHDERILAPYLVETGF